MTTIKTVFVEILRRVLPIRVKNAVFHLSYHLAREEFERFAYEYSFAPNMNLGLRAMASRGFSPSVIVDVGAFEGHWTRLAKVVWPASRFVMIEPNVEKREKLVHIAKDLEARLFCELLGAESGREVRFNVMGSGSSIMGERSSVPRKIELRRLRTLDSLLNDIESPGLLKIDAQSYELEILNGASGSLRAFEAVLLEVSMIEINEGAPLLHDVVYFMKECGFVAYDILEIHRRPLDQALNQLDIIFVREESKLVADKRHFA